MELTECCRGCKCSVCRRQRTDGCIHHRDPPCSRCEGNKIRAWIFAERYGYCEGYERKADSIERIQSE